MRRFIIKSLILIAVFIASAAVFFAFMNTDDTQSTKGMDAPSLPLLYMKYDETTLNRMCGFKAEIDEETYRKCVTLLPTDRTLTVCIDTFGNNIEDVSYRVTSLEDGSVLENGRVKNLETDGSMLTGTFRLETTVTMGREYMLRFEVNIEGSDAPVYYYTRLLQRNGQNLNWYLEYTEAFYVNCISGNLTSEMKSQLDPIETEQSYSYHTINIHSSSDMILWGDLEPSIVKKAVPTILEINEVTVSIGLDYIISSKTDTGETEYFAVSEFYRMRKNQDNVVLLDFERSVEEYFTGNRSALNGTVFSFGIEGKDIRYVTNDAGDIIAFAKAGEIWEYDSSAGKVCMVFSYRSSGSFDDRTVDLDYSLSISSVSDEGDVMFVVSGYAPAGAHEGTCGISMYKYSEKNNTTTELLFIPSSEGPEVLNSTVSTLAYVNVNDQCFIRYGNSVAVIELSDLSYSYMEEDVDWDTLAVSDSQTLVSWTQEDDPVIEELNLDTGNSMVIEAPSGQLIKNLGFIYEDLIYGLAYEDDCYTDSTGNSVFPMYKICVVDSSGTVKKTYETRGIYVTSVTRDDNILNMERVRKSGSRFIQTSNDQLLYYEPEDSSNINMRLTVTERKGTVVNLVFPSVGTSSLYTLTTRYYSETVPVIEMETPEMPETLYYVYAKGGLYGMYTAINEAIQIADDQVGVVLDRFQRYAWERGNIKTSVTLDIDSIPEGLLAAPMDESIFAKAVGEEYEIWNLTGCSLSSIKNQISSGYAVAGKWSDSENVLIIGYDNYNNIWIYDKTAGEAKAYTFDEAEEKFAAAGNVFLSYHS